MVGRIKCGEMWNISSYIQPLLRHAISTTCQSVRFLSWLKPLSLGSSPPLPVHAAWLRVLFLKCRSDLASLWLRKLLRLPVWRVESGPPSVTLKARHSLARVIAALEPCSPSPVLSTQQSYLGSLNIPSCFIPSVSLLLSGWNAVPASLPSPPVSKSLHLTLCPGALWKSC